MNNTLIESNPMKAIARFSVPIYLGILFQKIYSLTDTAIIGKFIGIEALSGVGSTDSLSFFVMGFVIGTCAGLSLQIAQSYGAKDFVKLKKYFTHSIYLAIIISFSLSFLSLLFLQDILEMLNTTEEMMPYSKTYITTIFVGIAGSFLYNLLAYTLRAIGNTKTPLIFLIISATINIFLDLIFILIFNMGVFGAAFATVLSQTLSGIFCIILINKKITLLQTKKQDWKFEFKTVQKLLILGLPMGLQFSITAVGSMMLQASVNSLGTIYAASVSASSKINSITTSFLESIGLSMATFAGQNLGAKKFDRIKKGIFHSLLLSLFYSIVAYCIIFLSVDRLILLVVSADELTAIENIRLFVLNYSKCFFILSLLYVFRNTLQGLGYSALAMLAGIMELIARIYVVIFLIPKVGFIAVVFASPIAWVFALCFLIPAYFIVIKKLKKHYIHN